MRTSQTAPTMLSRFTGCLLGGALGDALGYPVEFVQSASEMERKIGTLAQPRWPAKLAVVSDDTQMTMFTAEGLLRAIARYRGRGICHPVSIVHHAYFRWLATQTNEDALRSKDPAERGWLLDVPELHAQRDPGKTCLSALTANRFEGRHPIVDSPPNDSKGCGAVMRSAPIGLTAIDAAKAFEMARDAGVLTHGHASGYLSAAYFAVVIHGVAQGGASLADAMKTADDLTRGERGAEETLAAVAKARELAACGAPSRADLESLGGGWVGEEALAIALACALTTRDGSPESTARTLWRSVAHAGDSDSTGSLSGNLLGAMFGIEALPTDWLAGLEMRDVIERLAVDLHAATELGENPDKAKYPAI